MKSKIVEFKPKKKPETTRAERTLKKYIDLLTEDNKYILCANAYDLYKEQCRH